MGYPQQPNDPNQYSQQPYQQQPGYPQSPTPGTPNMGSVNFAAITAQENRAYLIAGVGGLIAFLGYFILPYWGYSYSLATLGSYSGSFTGSQFGSWLFLSMLGGLVAAVVAVIEALGISAVPQLTPQLASRILLGSGVASALGIVIFLLQYNSSLSGLGTVGSGVSYGLSFGFYLAVLATIAMLVGGFMAFRKTA